MNKQKMELGKKLDQALHYAAKNLRETGHNEKPVLSHSFKVANRLLELNYEENIVIAAVLHDLIEDTDITYDDLKKEYGQKIADIVQSVSFDPKIEDKLEQARVMFENSLNYGVESIIIKCSDLIENIDFVQFVENSDKRIDLLKKYVLFLDMVKDAIGNTDIYIELKNKVELYKV